MTIIQLRVTDRDYRGDNLSEAVETRNKTGFLSCVGFYGDIFGYNNTLWMCCAFGVNWHSDLVNTNSNRLVVTFSHGIQAQGDPGVYPEMLEVFEKYRWGHGRRRTWRRRLINCARVYNATHLLLRLQRWYRRVSQQWRARRLVIAMALHPRLGCNSGLATLSEDMLTSLEV